MRLSCTLYTDELIIKWTSVSGKNIGRVYTYGKVFVYVYPRPNKGNAGVALWLFYEMFGIPVNIIYDGSPDNFGYNLEFQCLMRKFYIICHQN